MARKRQVANISTSKLTAMPCSSKKTYTWCGPTRTWGIGKSTTIFSSEFWHHVNTSPKQMSWRKVRQRMTPTGAFLSASTILRTSRPSRSWKASSLQIRAKSCRWTQALNRSWIHPNSGLSLKITTSGTYSLGSSWPWTPRIMTQRFWLSLMNLNMKSSCWRTVLTLTWATANMTS